MNEGLNLGARSKESTSKKGRRIYVATGHGFLLRKYFKTQVTVPAKCRIVFWCNDNCTLDDDKGQVIDERRFDETGEEAPDVVTGGGTVPNYCLTAPVGLKPAGADYRGAIRVPKDQILTLREIITKVSSSGKPFTLHWSACRDHYPVRSPIVWMKQCGICIGPGLKKFAEDNFCVSCLNLGKAKCGCGKRTTPEKIR